MRLASLQKQFLDRVWGAPPLRDTRWILASSEKARLSRIGIYRLNYEGRALDLLISYFPRTRTALGARRFEMIACQFGQKSRARSPLLAAWTKEFPGFLRRLGKPAWVVELARLELAKEFGRFPQVQRTKGTGGRKRRLARPLELSGNARLERWGERALSFFLKKRTLRSARSKTHCIWLESGGRVQVWPLPSVEARILKWMKTPRSVEEVAAFCARQGLDPAQTRAFFKRAVSRQWLAVRS